MNLKKKILMIFNGNEGTTYFTNKMNNLNNVYHIGYEYFEQEDRMELNDKKWSIDNKTEIIKFFFNSKSKLDNFEYLNQKMNNNEYINKIKNYKYLYVKWRMPHKYYYLIDKIQIDYILIALRYDFEKPLGEYINSIKNLHQWNHNRNLEKNIIFNLDKDKLNFFINKQKKYLNDFVYTYNLLKNKNIFIVDYSKLINENNYFNKILNFINYENKLNKDENNKNIVNITKRNFKYIECIPNEHHQYINNIKNEYYNYVNNLLKNINIDIIRL